MTCTVPVPLVSVGKSVYRATDIEAIRVSYTTVQLTVRDRAYLEEHQFSTESLAREAARKLHSDINEAINKVHDTLVKMASCAEPTEP